MADHSFQVKVQLSAEEYLGLKMVAEDIGTTQSGLLRMLAKEKIRAHALNMKHGDLKSTDETARD